MRRKWLIGLLIAAAVPVWMFAASEWVDAQSTWRIPVKSGLTAGSLIYARDRSSLGALTAVATGQVLTSAGTSTVPAFSATPSVTSLTLAGTLSGARQNVTVSTTAAVTVAATDSGRVYVGTKTSGTQIYTLPALAAGLNFCFVAGHASGDVIIEPTAAAAIIGKGYSTGSTVLGIMNTEASNAIGDAVCVTSDGTSWYGYSTIGTWANNVAS